MTCIVQTQLFSGADQLLGCCPSRVEACHGAAGLHLCWIGQRVHRGASCHGLKVVGAWYVSNGSANWRNPEGTRSVWRQNMCIRHRKRFCFEVPKKKTHFLCVCVGPINTFIFVGFLRANGTLSFLINDIYRRGRWTFSWTLCLLKS